MIKTFINPSQIITVDTNGNNFIRGVESQQLKILENHSIIVENDTISDIIPNSALNKVKPDLIIDLKDKVVIPGLVDCHTHTVFTGSRAEEFRLKIGGATYEDIARSGGGINKTVRAVRESSPEELLETAKKRVEFFITHGITSLEIKSGYGLDIQNEIKLLRVIMNLQKNYPIDIVPTFLGAHTFPPEYRNNQDEYVELIIEKMLPYIVENKLAVFCDAYCEMLDFTPDQVDRVFKKSIRIGFKAEAAFRTI